MTVIRYESTGRVEYVIKQIVDEYLEEIYYLTEGKQNQLGIGIARNLMQCKSLCDVRIIVYIIFLIIFIRIFNLLKFQLFNNPYTFIHNNLIEKKKVES